MKAKLTRTQPDSDVISTYIAIPTANSPTASMTIHQMTHEARISSLPTSLEAFSATTLKVESHDILDAKFVDDATFLLLLRSTNADKICSIVSFAYTPTGDEATTAKNDQMIGQAALPGTTVQSALLPQGHAPPSSARYHVDLTTDVLRKCTRHVFEKRFTPLKLIVNGRKGRRVAVVLGSDRKHYRVLDLDFSDKEGMDRGEDESSGAEGRDVEMAGS